MRGLVDQAFELYVRVSFEQSSEWAYKALDLNMNSTGGECPKTWRWTPTQKLLLSSPEGRHDQFFAGRRRTNVLPVS